LKEDYYLRTADEFVPAPETRYRVLKLDGVYVQEVWEKVKTDGKDEYQIVSSVIPKLDGKELNYIPFFPCPGKMPENSPLLGIAYENIGHYQKSADYEQDIHYTGIHTPYAIGAEKPRDEKGDEKEVTIGGTKFLFFPTGSAVGYLETSGSTTILAAIQACEARMVQLSGQSIAHEKKGIEAAATARIHRAGENAVIGSFSLNIAEQLTPAVRLAARWRGVPEAITEQWSMAFEVEYASDLTPEEKSRFAMNEVDSDLMSKKRYLMEVKGLSEEEADKELERIKAEKPDFIVAGEDG
jgi:hypothetical protein